MRAEPQQCTWRWEDNPLPPIPTSEPFPRLLHDHQLHRWSELLVGRLEKHLGDFRLVESFSTLANGANNNIDLGKGYLVRLIGPTGAFSITGLAGGVPGRVVVLYNTTAQTLTLANQSASSGPANRILTLTGADVSTAGPCAFLLTYSDSRWIIISSNPADGGGGGGGGQFDTSQRALYDTIPLDLGTGTVNVNISGPGISGTPAAFQDTSGRYHTFTTSTLDASSVGWTGATNQQLQRQLLFDHTWIIRTGPASTDIESCTIWAVMDDVTGAQSVNSRQNQLGFRFRVSAGDTTWRCISTDSANNLTNTNSSVTVAFDTRYVLRLQWADINTVNFFINASQVATHTSSDNLPGPTVGLRPKSYIINNGAGTTRAIRIGGLKGSQL